MSDTPSSGGSGNSGGTGNTGSSGNTGKKPDRHGPSAAALIPLHGISGHGDSPHAVEEHSEGNWLVSYADMMTLLVGFFVILLSFAVIDPEKFDEARKSITQEFGGVYQVPYSELSDRLREVVKKLGVGDQLLIKQSDAGIEISFRGTVFFDTGSAELKEQAKPVLENLIAAIKTDSDPMDVTVEGHTDDVPIARGGHFRNNWELSSLRACRVLDSFIVSGFKMDRLTAVGYGEARPLVPNRDSDGNAISENQAQNRRVVIKIVRHAAPALPPSPGGTPGTAPPDGTAGADSTKVDSRPTSGS